jgi:hypothetical protein
VRAAQHTKCAAAAGLSVTLAALLGFSDAKAQLHPESQLGSRIPVKPQAVDPVRAGFVRKNFGRCVFQRNPAAAEKLLMNGDPISVDMKAAGLEKGLEPTFQASTCLGNQTNGEQAAIGMSFKNTVLRSLLAEEAYLAKFKAPAVLPDGATENSGREYVSTGDARAQAEGLGAYSDCLTFRDTAGADAVLRTMPGSAEERQAARTLAPVLGACLMQGQTISLTPTNVRAILADGLWNRYVRAQRSAPSVMK